MKRPELHPGSPNQTLKKDFVCPHCGTLQVTTGFAENLGAVRILVFRCANCRDVEIFLTLYDADNAAQPAIRAYPANDVRSAISFDHAPADIDAAYRDACLLFPIHTGASGAYARRALELILEGAGYGARSLADSIDAAHKEDDPDKRLPKRLLLRLNYIKEIGNFALHVRRNEELAIFTIDEQEVSACLETIEELVQFLFEEPVAEYKRITNLNEKLAASGKKLLELPGLPAHLQNSVALIEDQ